MIYDRGYMAILGKKKSCLGDGAPQPILIQNRRIFIIFSGGRFSHIGQLNSV